MADFDFSYNNEEMDIIAKQLFDLQEKENDGRGISCVKDIVASLYRHDLNSAVSVRQWDGDKTVSYFDVELYLTEKLGCRTHGKLNCTNKLLCSK